MGRYAKGFMAGFTGLFTTAMQVSDSFCGTWWPALVAVAGTVGVVAVPNARKSDALK